MNITKSKLKQIIKEEIAAVLESDSWAVPSNVQQITQQNVSPLPGRTLSRREIRALKQPFIKLNNAFLLRDKELGPPATHAKALEDSAKALSAPDHVMKAVYGVLDAAHAGDHLKFKAAADELSALLREE